MSYFFLNLDAVPEHVGHYRPVINARKLVVNAQISNRQDDSLFINIQLHVDDGCEPAEILLQPADAITLGLEPEGLPTTAVQADGTEIRLQEYGRVVVEMITDTADVWRATLTPMIILENEEQDGAVNHGVPGVDDTSRLLGYGGLNRFGVKQDFYNHRLIKSLRRL